MKKTLVALAALAATSAFAQSSVTIYGRAQADISNYSATGAAGAGANLTNRTRVADPGSRIGFIVNEDLGGGLRAFSTIETGLNLDTGAAEGQANTANANTNFLGSREAHVGIGNSAYELRLGRQNVYWTHGELNQTGANFLSTDVLGALYAGSSGMTVGNASRLNNTILVQFNKDSILGADFAGSHVYYSTQGGEYATTDAASPNKASTQGFKLNWNNGNWAGMIDYSASRNFGRAADLSETNNATTVGNYDQKSTKYALGYKYAPGSIVSYTIFSHSRDFNVAATNTVAPTVIGAAAVGGRQQSGSGFNLVHNFGNEIYGYGQYGVMNRAQNAQGAEVAETGATVTLLGVRKNLSKRTGVYAFYGTIKNETANAINFSNGAYASGTSAAGADPKVTAIGIQHLF